MPKRAPRYANPESIVSKGFRRLSKRELSALGYSARSVLYTSASAKKPTKFLTRADIAHVQEPSKRAFRETSQFRKTQRELMRRLLPVARRYRHTYDVYKSYVYHVSSEQAYTLTYQFLKFLETAHHPRPRNEIRMIYKSLTDDFSITQYWDEREEMLAHIKRILDRYKKDMKLLQIIGTITQSQ